MTISKGRPEKAAVHVERMVRVGGYGERVITCCASDKSAKSANYRCLSIIEKNYNLVILIEYHIYYRD